MPKGIYKHHSNQGFKKGYKESKGSKNGNWKGGKPHCIDCDKEINYYRKRCRKCNDIFRVRGKAHNWKGGITYSSGGYKLIYQPKHPFAGKTGYIREHRLIMEKYLGRYLKKEEEIHHINGIKTANQIENLLLLTHKEHTKLHNNFHRN